MPSCRRVSYDHTPWFDGRQTWVLSYGHADEREPANMTQPGWTPPNPTTAPKKAKRWPWFAAIAAALLIGGAIGSSGGDTPTATPQPAETVTVTETKTETVETTPASCIEALDAAENVIAYASQSLDIVADSFEAVSEFDVDRVEANTKKMEALTPKIAVQRDVYNPAAEDCRASK